MQYKDFGDRTGLVVLLTSRVTTCSIRWVGGLTLSVLASFSFEWYNNCNEFIVYFCTSHSYTTLTKKKTPKKSHQRGYAGGWVFACLTNFLRFAAIFLARVYVVNFNASPVIQAPLWACVFGSVYAFFCALKKS